MYTFTLILSATTCTTGPPTQPQRPASQSFAKMADLRLFCALTSGAKGEGTAWGGQRLYASSLFLSAVTSTTELPMQAQRPVSQNVAKK